MDKLLFLLFLAISLRAQKDYSGYTLRGGPKDVMPEVLARHKEESHFERMHRQIMGLKNDIQKEQDALAKEQEAIDDMRFENGINRLSLEPKKYTVTDILKKQITLEDHDKLIKEKQTQLKELETSYAAWVEKEKKRKALRAE